MINSDIFFFTFSGYIMNSIILVWSIIFLLTLLEIPYRYYDLKNRFEYYTKNNLEFSNYSSLPSAKCWIIENFLMVTTFLIGFMLMAMYTNLNDIFNITASQFKVDFFYNFFESILSGFALMLIYGIVDIHIVSIYTKKYYDDIISALILMINDQDYNKQIISLNNIQLKILRYCANSDIIDKIILHKKLEKNLISGTSKVHSLRIPSRKI